MIYSDTPYANALRKNIKANLKGKVIACWCAPLQCHADIIASIANEVVDENVEKNELKTSMEELKM